MAVCYQVKSSRTTATGHLDAEFYQPKYKYLDRLIAKKTSEVADIFTTNAGYAFPSGIFFDEGEYPVVKMTQIPGNGFVDLQNAEYVRRSSFEEVFENFTVEKGDIVVALTGATVGKSGMYVDRVKSLLNQRVFSARDKSKQFSTNFLLPLFLSKVFRDWVYRNSLGGGQGNIAPESIKQFPILDFSESFVRKVENLVEDAAGAYFQSKNLYPEAEQELLERVEWDKVRAEHILNYTATSKDIVGDERLDPEFYQPKFENLEKHLKKIGAMKIADVCSFVNHGIQPPYFEDGKVAVITQKEMTPTFLELESIKDYTNETFYSENQDFQLKKRDVLLYSVGAYIGRCNILLDEVRAMAGSFITILRGNEKLIVPEYLSLFLNSQAGIMQSKQRMRGTAQHYLYPRDIKEISVFIPRDKSGKPDLAWQKKLADKVVAANEAKKSAKQKIEEAKQLVETEIEKML